jgi:hypothetical protein
VVDGISWATSCNRLLAEFFRAHLFANDTLKQETIEEYTAVVHRGGHPSGLKSIIFKSGLNNDGLTLCLQRLLESCAGKTTCSC